MMSNAGYLNTVRIRRFTMEKQVERSINTIEITIGELVEVLTQVAREDSDTEVESYELAAQTLGEILSRQNFDFSRISA